MWRYGWDPVESDAARGSWDLSNRSSEVVRRQPSQNNSVKRMGRLTTIDSSNSKICSRPACGWWCRRVHCPPCLGCSDADALVWTLVYSAVHDGKISGPSPLDCSNSKVFYIVTHSESWDESQILLLNTVHHTLVYVWQWLQISWTPYFSLLKNQTKWLMARSLLNCLIVKNMWEPCWAKPEFCSQKLNYRNTNVPLTQPLTPYDEPRFSFVAWTI